MPQLDVFVCQRRPRWRVACGGRAPAGRTPSVSAARRAACGRPARAGRRSRAIAAEPPPGARSRVCGLHVSAPPRCEPRLIRIQQVGAGRQGRHCCRLSPPTTAPTARSRPFGRAKARRPPEFAHGSQRRALGHVTAAGAADGRRGAGEQRCPDRRRGPRASPARRRRDGPRAAGARGARLGAGGDGPGTGIGGLAFGHQPPRPHRAASGRRPRQRLPPAAGAPPAPPPPAQRSADPRASSELPGPRGGGGRRARLGTRSPAPACYSSAGFRGCCGLGNLAGDRRRPLLGLASEPVCLLGGETVAGLLLCRRSSMNVLV